MRVRIADVSFSRVNLDLLAAAEAGAARLTENNKRMREALEQTAVHWRSDVPIHNTDASYAMRPAAPG